MAFPRSKQDADVGRPGRAPQTRLSIAHGGGRQEPDNLVANRLGRLAHGAGGHDPEDGVVIRLKPDTTVARRVLIRLRGIRVRGIRL